MTEILTTVTRKGQITIPASIRKELGIEVGDKVSFSLLEGQDGVILVRPVRSVADMTYGLAAALSPVASTTTAGSLHELREQFEISAAEDVMDSLTGEK